MTSQRSIQDKYFTLTAQEAVDAGPYDIIIVGSGAGGGTIAADLFDTNYAVGDVRAVNVLLIEKGDVIFPTHALNLARPTALRNRARESRAYFEDFKSDYPVDDATKETWKGGPLYALGGRTTVWDLATGRIHDRVLDENFPQSVVDDLRDTYYALAETTLKVGARPSGLHHRRVMEKLDASQGASTKPNVKWEWAKTPSRAHGVSNYHFPEGAWSSVDRLLEIAMNRPTNASGDAEEHPKFKILLQAEVRSIVIEKPKESGALPRATGVKVLARVKGEKDPKSFTIKLRKPPGESAYQLGMQTYQSPVYPTVILCAGSVHSPEILMRSGVSLKGATHLTEREMIYASFPFRYLDKTAEQCVGGMNLRSFVTNVSSSPNEVFLANVAFDTTFRSDPELGAFPRMHVSVTRSQSLNTQNSITSSDNNTSFSVRILPPSGDLSSQVYEDLKKVADAAMTNIQDIVDVVYYVLDPKQATETLNWSWTRLPSGYLGEEMGSVPMPNPKLGQSGLGVVDENLRLRGYQGICVCDLSVMPMCPETPPTLTLMALGFRLSRYLYPPKGKLRSTSNTSTIVNHSGGSIWVVPNEAMRNKRPRIPGGNVPPWEIHFQLHPKTTLEEEKEKLRALLEGDPTRQHHKMPPILIPIIGGPLYHPRLDTVIILTPGDTLSWKQLQSPESASTPPEETISFYRSIGNGQFTGPAESMVVKPGGPIAVISPLVVAADC